MKSAHRIAFVLQRYGLEVNGGAELHCRWLAEHLSHHLAVDVLTTCAVDYDRWANYYPPGVAELNGVRVYRFPVDRQRNLDRFRETTVRLFTNPHDLLAELDWMRQQGPISSRLLRFLADERESYDAFIFFTYLYGTTYYGLQLVPDRALLVPTAHDEPFLYLDIFRSVFNLPRFIIYNTESERRLVQRIFANAHMPSAVVGTGINVPPDVSGDRFRAKFGLNGDLLVYVGRVDPSKHVHELFDRFLAFRTDYEGDLKLVVMGQGTLPIPQHPDVVPLGFVSEEDKFDGIRAASALVVPSKYESLSMAVLEAWRAGTPVLVNGECEVLKEQCRLGHGGLWYQSQQEFDLALRVLLSRPDLRCRLGESGRAYAETMYAWDRVVDRYLKILEWLQEEASGRSYWILKN